MHTYVVCDDRAGREPGFVGERLEARGADLHLVDRMTMPAFDSLATPELVLLLGSHLSAHEPANAAAVAAESRFALAALDSGVPVMAICYGAQLMARALGGTSYRNDVPELGWKMVDTDDAILCPPGPWAQLHKDVFEAAPTSTVLAMSAAGQQSFIDTSRAGRVIAWQFHPEVRAAVLNGWIDQDAAYYESYGSDTAALKDETRAREALSRSAGHALTDNALNWLQST